MTGGKNKIFLVILATGLICSSVYSQEQMSPSGDWEIRLIPYFWMPSLDAEGTVSGLSGNVDLSFGDVTDYLNFAAMGRIEAWKNKWGLTFDGLYMNLGASESFKVAEDWLISALMRMSGWVWQILDWLIVYVRSDLVIITSSYWPLSRMADFDMLILDRKLI